MDYRRRPASRCQLELEGSAPTYTGPLWVGAEPEQLSELHRLGFVLKRPKNRLVKADPMRRREAFVGEYAALTAAARRTGVKIFFADGPISGLTRSYGASGC